MYLPNAGGKRMHSLPRGVTRLRCGRLPNYFEHIIVIIIIIITIIIIIINNPKTMVGKIRKERKTGILITVVVDVYSLKHLLEAKPYLSNRKKIIFLLCLFIIL